MGLRSSEERGLPVASPLSAVAFHRFQAMVGPPFVAISGLVVVFVVVFVVVVWEAPEVAFVIAANAVAESKQVGNLSKKESIPIDIPKSLNPRFL